MRSNATPELPDEIESELANILFRETAPHDDSIHALSTRHPLWSDSILNRAVELGFDVGVSVAQTDSEPGGPRIVGPYRIDRKLGEGGFGVVYLAERMDSTRRQVALKLLKPGMDSRSILRAFAQESRLLSAMDHPFIATMLDSGMADDGRTFFAMDFIDGLPITQYCDDAQLSLTGRIDLFERVCHGVQHAHQKTVIHRDLTPNNILVTEQDGEAVPKIIDFGLARVLDPDLALSTSMSGIGERRGTLLYMSPEQVARHKILGPGQSIDTRADVYALGAILYELLAGRSPLPLIGDEGVHEIERQIVEVTPLPPSSWTENGKVGSSASSHLRAGGVRGDLDWIVMRALEKDPDRRYPTPLDLARDLRRFLKHEPVEAGPPSTRYRMRKFVRRHRAATAATLAIVLAVLIGTFGTAIGFIRASSNFTRSEVAAAFLLDTLLRIDPDVDGLDLTVAELLDRSLIELPERFAEYPDLEASVQGHFAQAYTKLGRFEAAASAYADQVAILEREQGPEALVAAAARRNQANALLQLGRVDEAEKLALASLAIQQEKLEDDDPELAAILQMVAAIEHERGEFAKALTRQRDVVRRFQESEYAYEPDTATAMNLLVTLLVSAGELEEAIEVGHETMQAWRRIDGEDSSHALVVENAVASVYRRLERHDDAVDLLRKNLEGRRRVFGEEHVKTWLVAGNLANLLVDLERNDEAEEIFLRTIEAARRMEIVPPALLAPFSNYAWLLYRSDRTQEAAELFREYLEHGARTWGASHWRLGEGHRSLGLVLFSMEVDDEAEMHFVRGYEILSGAFGDDDSRTQRVIKNLVHFFQALDRADEVRAWEARQ